MSTYGYLVLDTLLTLLVLLPRTLAVDVAPGQGEGLGLGLQLGFGFGVLRVRAVRVRVRVRVGAALLIYDRPRVHKPHLLGHVGALVPGLFGVLRVLACGSHHLSHRRHRIAWGRMVRVRVSNASQLCVACAGRMVYKEFGRGGRSVVGAWCEYGRGGSSRRSVVGGGWS